MTPRALRGIACAALLGALHCGPPPVGPSPTLVDTRTDAARFAALEDAVVRDLVATDKRLARRFHVNPREDDLARIGVAAVLAEDATLVLVDGAPDPLSFDARGRALAIVQRNVKGASVTGEPRARIEALVDEELLRLDEERLLPRSSSELLRAIVDTWTPPRSPADAAERDKWLARRLTEMKVAADGAKENEARALGVARAHELDDALDDVERIAAGPGFGKTAAAIVALRELLEVQAARPRDQARSDWPATLSGLRGHFAEPDRSAEAIDQVLAEAAARLRTRAETARRETPTSDDALERDLDRAMFMRGPCAEARPESSRVAQADVSPEREPYCHLSHAKLTPLARLVALHDHVVVARWALAVANGTQTIGQVTGRVRPIVTGNPALTARCERLALARPVTAIGTGLAIAREP